MGAALCSGTEAVVSGSFHMKGVPTAVVAEIFCDVESWPVVHPYVISVEFIRGHPGQVGSCWMERRRFRNQEILMRKNVVRRSEDEGFFSTGHALEVLEGGGWGVQKSFATYTITIRDESDGCTVCWNDAFLSTGVCGKIFLALLLPCLRRSFTAHVLEEWQAFYEEALRRTVEEARGEETPQVAQKSSAND